MDSLVRPAVALPSRSAMDSLVRPVDISPGLSSLLSEDPELGFPSFSLLLAGAMEPPDPVSLPTRRAEDEDTTAVPKRDSGRGVNEVSLSLGRSRPANLEVNEMPLITFTAGISPSSLFQSPLSFYTSNQGQFGLLNQLNQSQATAQAAQLHSYPYIPIEYPCTLSAATTSLRQQPSPHFNFSSPQQMSYMPNTVYGSTPQAASLPLSAKKSQPSNLIVDKPADDGYNWRKYGQKQVKGGEYPRSYYKCTHPKCPVKKKVERSFDGQVTEIIYKGQHNHQPPQQNKHGKEGGGLLSEPGDLNSESEATYKRDREFTHGSEHLSDFSDDEQYGETSAGRDEMNENESDIRKMKIDARNIQTASYKTVTEPKVIVQTTSEVDLLDDGYRWRKYGQKVVKGNPHARSYYKCTNVGCNVRKHVERGSANPEAVITTYEGKHNHDVPAARNSSHSNLNASASASNHPQTYLHSNHLSFNGTNSRPNLEQPVAVHPKKEQDGT